MFSSIGFGNFAEARRHHRHHGRSFSRPHAQSDYTSDRQSRLPNDNLTCSEVQRELFLTSIKALKLVLEISKENKEMASQVLKSFNQIEIDKWIENPNLMEGHKNWAKSLFQIASENDIKTTNVAVHNLKFINNQISNRASCYNELNHFDIEYVKSNLNRILLPFNEKASNNTNPNN